MKSLFYLFIPFTCATLPLSAAGQFDPALSPFKDKAADSYSNSTTDDGKPNVLLWGLAPLNDFGSREVKLDQTGVRQLSQIPAPGVHPRILFGPDDLPAVRARIKNTRCGQEAWKNILGWTHSMKGTYDDSADYAKPDLYKGSYQGFHGRIPVFRLNADRGKGGYNHNPAVAAFYDSLIKGTATDFPAFYWNTLSLEAFRCLIDNDADGAKRCAAATVNCLKIDQLKRDAERIKKKSAKPIEEPIGRFQLAFAYDYLYLWLTPTQKKLIHDELAESTWSHDNYGTFNTAESSRSNWATFSYWLYEVLAIEGEAGFNDLKVRGMYRGWRNLFTYGWFQSGATFEGEAKNQLGMDGVILFAMRDKAYGFENLCGHPYLQAYAKKFLPHSSNPMLTGFHKYDLLGGSRSAKGGFAPMDSLGLKFMFPDDKVIDWYYRQAIHEDYSGVPDRPDGYFNALLFYAIFATDFNPTNNDPAKLQLGNTFFCGERALMMTRSGWDKDATQLNMHTRQANGGHPFADRNAIMVAGAGRIWSPNGYASFRTTENSVVSIDGQSQSEIVPGRCVDFVDQPLASFMVGDAKYAWDWNWKRLEKKPGFYSAPDVEAGKIAVPAGYEPVKETVNDFAFTKLPYAYLTVPHFQYPHWILPKGALSPYVRKSAFPVVRAFRTAGLVRGESPYLLVVDDIQKDNESHRYDWTLAVEHDIQIARIDKKNDREMDVYLTGADPDQSLSPNKDPLPSELAAGTTIPANQPMLLVRVLNISTETPIKPEIVELPNVDNAKKYGTIRRLIIASKSISPDFKVLLYAYRNGASLPISQWNSNHDSLTLTSNAQKDQIQFVKSPSGKYNLSITRNGQNLIQINKDLPTTITK